MIAGKEGPRSRYEPGMSIAMRGSKNPYKKDK